VSFRYLVNRGIKLSLLSLIDNIWQILSYHWLIGWNNYHIQPVDFAELVLFCYSCTCHSRQLLIHPEIVLECNGGQGLGLPFNLDTLFGLNSLMQTFAVSASQHQPPGKLIYYDYFTVFDHIIPVPLHQGVGF